ncbi:hypothetical protein [Spiroplasma apis]|nr:hypothetical protein [Spiroplasma apis]
MEFKKIKKVLRKPVLWMASTVFTILLITIIIISSLSIATREKISWSLQISLNFVIILFISKIMNMSKSTISLFYNVQVTFVEETKAIEIKKSRYVHLFIHIFTIGCFFIEVASGSMINKQSWLTQIENFWWIYLLVYFLNIVYFYLFFGMTLFVFKTNEDFKNDYLTYYENVKKKE